MIDTGGNQFSQRQQYIKTNNELRRPTNKKLYIKGNKQRAELDRKLEDLSIKNDVMLSSTAIRKKILDAGAFGDISSAPIVTETVESEEPVFSEKPVLEKEREPIDLEEAILGEKQPLEKEKKPIDSYEKHSGKLVNTGKVASDNILYQNMNHYRQIKF